MRFSVACDSVFLDIREKSDYSQIFVGLAISSRKKGFLPSVMGTSQCSPVFQVIFNKISASEMAALPKDLQLDLLSEFQFLPGDLDSLDGEHFGRVSRDGRSLLRYRAKDYRIYFEHHAEGLLVHRVLHKNTIRDFLFRSNLPLDEEDSGLSKTNDFWKLIHEAEETRA